MTYKINNLFLWNWRESCVELCPKWAIASPGVEPESTDPKSVMIAITP